MSYPSFITTVANPAFLTLDSVGNLYIANNTNGTITKYGPDGVEIGPTPFISGLNGPYGIAFDSLGDLYVTNNSGGTVRKYTSAGVQIGTNPYISGLNGPQGLAFDSAHNLYVVNNGGGTVTKYTSAGVRIGNDLISGLTNPHGITIDSAGDLYVSHNSSVEKFTSSGVPIGANPFISSLSNPHGLAFDSLGNLYVANYSTNIIGKYTSDGTPINTSLISGLSNPQGIAFDSLGNLYVANYNTKLIGKYKLPNISSIYPILGLISGGTSVTITGNNFVPNMTTVQFGSSSATSVNVNSSGTSITCVTPISLAGSVDVVVTRNDGFLETLTNGFTYLVRLPISNICFPAGTPITTNQGTFPIEKINQAIHTIRNKKIVGITQTVTQDKYLVCFEKDSLGINLPSQKTIISKNHGIFYKGKMLHAKEFINKFENVKKIKYTGEILYNVLMEDHDKMMVNNLICETLHPENGTAKLYKCLQNLNPKEQQNLIENCNEYAIKNKVFSCKKITK